MKKMRASTKRSKTHKKKTHKNFKLKNIMAAEFIRVSTSNLNKQKKESVNYKRNQAGQAPQWVN